jgi:hypothetical protein
VRARRSVLIALVCALVAVLAIVKARQADHLTAGPSMLLTGKVSGSFVRSGCAGCGPLTAKILTSDTYCGWSKRSVIVHVTLRNSSAERVTVLWRPIYSTVEGAPQGRATRSTRETPLRPGETQSLFVSLTPKGVRPGARLERCSPTLEAVSSG